MLRIWEGVGPNPMVIRTRGGVRGGTAVFKGWEVEALQRYLTEIRETCPFCRWKLKVQRLHHLYLEPDEKT